MYDVKAHYEISTSIKNNITAQTIVHTHDAMLLSPAKQQGF